MKLTVEYSETLAAVNAMKLEDRIQLIEDICDGIEAEHDSTATDLAEDVKDELDRRLTAHKESPDNVIPWEAVKDELLARIKK